jgi:signal peptidase II
MPPLRRTGLVLVTLLSCVGCDQKTKSLAKQYLRGREAVSFFGDTVRLDYAENPGAFLSLGASLSAKWRTAAFTIGAAVGLAAILSYALFASRSGMLQVFGLSLFCAGGIGNLVDRIVFGGYVRDFLNLGVGPVRTGIFNLADVALMTGCLLLFLQSNRRRQSPSP